MQHDGWWHRGLLGFCAALTLAGCSVITTAERAYVSNRDCLGALSRTAEYEVDPSLYELTAADVREDSLTFQYRGVEHVGDAAWVVRFSVKSTEQAPTALLDPYRILPVIAQGRSGFSFVDDGERQVDGRMARWVKYRFESPVYDESARPLPGRGIIATVALGDPESPVVCHLKLDNYGDREDVGWDDLRPFMAALGLAP